METENSNFNPQNDKIGHVFKGFPYWIGCHYILQM